MTPILSVAGIGPRMVVLLAEKGISTTEQLAITTPAALRDIPGIGIRRAETILAAARLALEGIPPKNSKVRKAPAQAAAREATEKAAIKDGKDKKKAAAKKLKIKKKASTKKATGKMKAKEKAAEKKAAKKEAKASKRKKSGKSKKK